MKAKHDETRGIAAPNELVRTIVADTAQRKFSNALRSVILTGSLARNEGTFVPVTDGFKLRGDCDLLLLFNDNVVLPSEEETRAFDAFAQNELAKGGIIGCVGAAAVHSQYLRNLEPSTFTYELLVKGDVLWGDQNCLAEIPAFHADQIPLEDAWRTLANRLTELLPFLYGRNASPEDFGYALLKLYLDMATSLLVFARYYKPSYLERSLEIKRLSAAGQLPAGLNGDFAERVCRLTECKLTGSSWDVYFKQEQLAIEAIRDAKALWRWELERLTDISDGSLGQLWQTWAEKQPFSSKMRGLLSLVKSNHWLVCAGTWPRWTRMSFVASPRYWIYRATSQLLFERDVKDVARFLPLDPAGPLTDSEEAACEIYRNYTTLLVNTRA